jgi:hypothetical protein
MYSYAACGAKDLFTDLPNYILTKGAYIDESLTNFMKTPVAATRIIQPMFELKLLPIANDTTSAGFEVTRNILYSQVLSRRR